MGVARASSALLLFLFCSALFRGLCSAPLEPEARVVTRQRWRCCLFCVDRLVPLSLALGGIGVAPPPSAPHAVVLRFGANTAQQHLLHGRTAAQQDL